MLNLATIGYISINEEDTIPNSVKIKEALREKVLEIWNKEEELNIITGLARGTDQLFCEIGIKLKKEYKKAKIRITAIVPYQQQAMLWSQNATTHYNDLLKKIDKIECLSEGSFEIGKIRERNKEIIRRADCVIFTEHGDNVDFYKQFAEESKTPYEILELTPYVVKKKNLEGEKANGKAN